jgi:hypothetical protein
MGNSYCQEARGPPIWIIQSAWRYGDVRRLPSLLRDFRDAAVYLAGAMMPSFQFQTAI